MAETLLVSKTRPSAQRIRLGAQENKKFLLLISGAISSFASISYDFCFKALPGRVADGTDGLQPFKPLISVGLPLAEVLKTK